MFKLNKKNSLIISVALAIVGLISLIFYKANSFTSFLSCLFFGGAMIMVGVSTKFKYEEDLIELDKNLNNMLKDAEINGEESEYNDFTDNDRIFILKKFKKKNKRVHFWFKLFGALLIFSGIFMLI